MAGELPAVAAGEEIVGEGEEPAGEESMAEESAAARREDEDVVVVRDACDLICLVLALAMSILSRTKNNAPFYTPADTPI